MGNIPFRTVIDFPISENVPCWLSSVVSGEGFNYKYLDIRHGTKRKSLVKGREGKLLSRYFNDRYFFGDDENSNDNSKWNISYIITILGGESIKSNLSNDEFIEEATKELNKLKGSEYFIKTRLVLNTVKNRRFINRGLHPYVSKTQELKYSSDEDKDNKFILFGQDNLNKLK